MTDDDKPKLVHLPSEPNEFRGAIESMERELPHMLRWQKAIARMQRARFLALLEEGFTRDEALALTTDMSIWGTEA